MLDIYNFSFHFYTKKEEKNYQTCVEKILFLGKTELSYEI